MDTNRKLIRSTGIIGFATLSSRILGFIRVVLFARLFGTSAVAQAFVVAFKLPNMLRDMIGEGASNAAIVPVLTEYRQKSSEDEYWDVARVILNLMLLVVVTLSLLGVLFAPAIIRMIAPGFLKDPQKFSNAVLFARFLFPYIIFLGLVAYSTGVLHSLQFFAAPAFASVILNSTVICALLLILRYPVLGIKTLVAGVLLGGVLQVSLQVPFLWGRGFGLKGGFKVRHPVAARVGRLLLPRFLGATVYQFSVLIDTVLASLGWIVGEGAVSALDYAHRIIHLPLAIFGISLATAALPRMSKEVASNDTEKLRKTISFSLNSVFTVMIPATAGLLVIAKPIIQALFQRGEFGGYSTSITSDALFFYAFGLFAYAGIKILVNAFYSMGDTKTPVKTAAISLAVNLVFNLMLMRPLKVGGLALATSIAATVNLLILFFILDRKIGDIGIRPIVASLMKIVFSSVVMAVFTFLGKRFLLGSDISGLAGFVKLSIVITGSGIIYLLAACIVGVEGPRRVWGMVVDRIKR